MTAASEENPQFRHVLVIKMKCQLYGSNDLKNVLKDRLIRNDSAVLAAVVNRCNCDGFNSFALKSCLTRMHVINSLWDSVNEPL